MKSILKKQKQLKNYLMNLSSLNKNKVLKTLKNLIEINSNRIKKENALDILNAKELGHNKAYIDRLTLNDSSIKSMIEGIEEIINMKDPINSVTSKFSIEEGLKVKKVRVPLGVILIIYESRPNVTIDAGSLCFKSGNIALLRGSSVAINSNKFLIKLFKEALLVNNVDEDVINYVNNPSRKELYSLIKEDNYIDIIIPRGSKELKDTIINKSKIPVIVTGEGKCHAYIDKTSDIKMIKDIIINAKTQRPATCNSVETILFNKEIDINKIIELSNALIDKNVELRYEDKIIEKLKEKGYSKLNKIKLAKELDFSFEYLTNIVSAKYVQDVKEACQYINENGSHHSDTIITDDKKNAEYFLKNIDSACVYHNASTRFSDGSVFGLGLEIGISTQKLHARGPMGLEALTTYKYVVEGKGHVRNNR